ncbi:sugar nucleotide-binding protein [Simiduia curdlanivorans]|uniref:dTDP-4-dehydrorhamnose reductase n=1 Tax=Simiduia curdlanivorans TaxID=1492769 RepID=A0ABV8VCC7_9GAMM|nr:sugar nucleotide-binding protein [Simiduia curdlanivorans]MDN3638521.1 sugar nucleotide-binding protein [Simiduia curdlanivorans]
MAINILLTDTSSPLGIGLRNKFESTTFRFVAEHPAELSWRDESQVREYLAEVKPHLVLNTIGWGEGTAIKPDLLADGAECLGRCLAGSSASVLHLSSYRIFHGEGKVSHTEADVPKAASDLSKAFAQAESAILGALPSSLVLRSSWVLSTEGGSLLARLLADFEAGRSTVISEHWRGTPVMVSDVVRAVYAVTQQIIYGANNWGVMHFGSSDVCSESVFAHKIQDMVQAETGRLLQLEAIETETDNSAVLEVRRLRDCFGLQPRSWRQGLRPAVRRWLDRRGLLAEVDSAVVEND